jgi:hypothetical protein
VPTPTLSPTPALPSLVILSTPIPVDIQRWHAVAITDAYVTTADVYFDLSGGDFSSKKIRPKTLPARFPSGTKQLVIALVFHDFVDPRSGMVSFVTNSETQTLTPTFDKTIPIYEKWILVTEYDSTGATQQMAYGFFEKQDGEFEDGPYKVSLVIDNVPRAILTFTIGTP